MIKAMDACGVNCESNSEIITADKHKKLKVSDFSPCHFLVERRKMSEPFSLFHVFRKPKDCFRNISRLPHGRKKSFYLTLLELFLNRFLDYDVRWKILSLIIRMGFQLNLTSSYRVHLNHMAERGWALAWV